MKPTIVILLLAIAAAGTVVWFKQHPVAKPPEEKAAGEEQKVSRDDKGQVVVKMSDELQGNAGLLVAKPEPARMGPELKGYGRVVDSAPLAALVSENASDRAAAIASSNELARVKTLAAQNNASQRALQTAEATASRDQVALRSAADRLALSWGSVAASQADLVALVDELVGRKATLVRVDLSAGDRLDAAPKAARLFTLSGAAVSAAFLGDAPNVDPQTLSRGYILIVRPNLLGLLPGEALTAFIELPGDTIPGVVVPRDAVVRTEGAGWVYTLDSGGDSFTRRRVELDRPVPAGWFLSRAVGTNDNVVVQGAQTLLSEELKASLKAD